MFKVHVSRMLGTNDRTFYIIKHITLFQTFSSFVAFTKQPSSNDKLPTLQKLSLIHNFNHRMKTSTEW